MVLGVDGCGIISGGIISEGYGFSGNIIIRVLYFFKKKICMCFKVIVALDNC
jgi:hypothetical protein